MTADPYALGLALSAKGHHAEAIAQYECALAAKPDDPRVLFALGNTARALGMPRPAEEFYRRVLALEPLRLEAIVNLANLLRAQGQFEAAKRLLEPALSRSGEVPELWLTLGSVYRESDERSQAKECYRKALVLRPNCAAALANLADLLSDEGRHEEALALYDRALKAEPDNAQARLNRAILHLLRGELKQGWRDYAARLKLPGKVPLADHGLPHWDGRPLKRTRLLVTAEQGVGDQIMFASLIGELAARATAEGGRVLLECEPRLQTLFARSFSSLTVHKAELTSQDGQVRARYGWLKAAGGANAAIELGNLPRLLRPTLESFPEQDAYLRPDPTEVDRWHQVFADWPRPLIGLCWRSGKTGGGRAVQFAPLERWAEFARALPGTAVCVQYDAQEKEVAALRALSGRDVVVPAGLDQKNELDRTAAMLSALDAVVSAPTAVSWLAAAVGIDTYKVLYDTSWTAFGQRFEPFAPKARCVMPRAAGDWADVFAQASAALNRRFSPA
jgi:tetratricopeptide (TPR) repeat protein